MRNQLSITVILALILSIGGLGCSNSLNDTDKKNQSDSALGGKADAPTTQTAERNTFDSIFDVVNQASFETLDEILDVRAARAIVRYREGPDRQADTNDDRTIESIDELRSISWVADRAIRRLKAFVGQTSSTARSETVTVSFEHLPKLNGDFVYEGWLIVDGTPKSAGRFSREELLSDGETEFTVNDVKEDPDAYVLTIEPDEGDEPAPSKVHLLAGSFDESGTANLSISHPKALGTNLMDARGSYLLATPSAPDAPNSQGIWFLNKTAQGPIASLELPSLPSGWTYEGWIVGPDGPVSTGRFKSVSGADSDGAGDAAGSGSTPPFPGQDFISPPMDLVGKKAVITVEPQPDTSAKPFAVKPLVDSISDRSVQHFSKKNFDRPTGQARLDVSDVDSGEDSTDGSGSSDDNSTAATEEEVLHLANTANCPTLRNDVGLDIDAVENIQDYRTPTVGEVRAADEFDPSDGINSIDELLHVAQIGRASVDSIRTFAPEYTEDEDPTKECEVDSGGPSCPAIYCH